MNSIMKQNISFLLVFLFLVSCSTVPITGRKQFSLVSDAKLLPMAFQQYQGFLEQNKLSSNVTMTNQLKSVGKRISGAVDRYMRANGMSDKADAYRWEFNLIDDKTVNAWAMPGGKTVFYTGIMPIAKNELLKQILHSWKRHSARAINQRMHREGQLCQHESYDHIVRNTEQLKRIQKYIANNPKNLKAGEFVYHKVG